MTGRLVDYKRTSWPERVQLVTIDIRDVDFAESFDRLKGGEVTVTIRKRSGHRSLDANKYAWILMDRIAQALTVRDAKPYSAVDIYRDAILEIPGVSEIFTVRQDAVARFRAGWEHNGLGWQSRTMPSRVPGHVDVILYYGSSSYDSRQMGALLDYLIALGESLDVETATPEERDRLCSLWAQAEEVRA